MDISDPDIADCNGVMDDTESTNSGSANIDGSLPIDTWWAEGYGDSSPDVSGIDEVSGSLDSMTGEGAESTGLGGTRRFSRLRSGLSCACDTKISILANSVLLTCPEFCFSVEVPMRVSNAYSSYDR